MKTQTTAPARLGFLSLTLLCTSLLLPSGSAQAQRLGVEGFGVRGGFANDPDLVVLGFHLDIGELAPGLILRTAFEAGSGDDANVLTADLQGLYHVELDRPWRPYFGIGVSLARIDEDRRRRDDDFDIAGVLIGGLHYRVRDRLGFFVELDVATSKAYDEQLLFGVTF